MCAALLVPYQDVVQARVRRQMLVQRKVGSAGIPEDGRDTFSEKALEDDLGTGEHSRRCPSLLGDADGMRLDHL
jgi:hypothetical protein